MRFINGAIKLFLQKTHQTVYLIVIRLGIIIDA